MRMFDPEGIVGDRLDLARCLQYPAFAPGIDDAMVAGSVGQESQWQFEDDCMAILTRPRILPEYTKRKLPFSSVDVRENRISGVGIIVICHDWTPPPQPALRPGRPRSATR